MNIENLRRDYRQKSLRRTDLSPDPLIQFQQWIKEAIQADIIEPNAMVLATAALDGKPSCRTVLMKNFDEQGIIFFTNYQSRKALEMTKNPHAVGLFLWKELERQLTVEGVVERVNEEEAKAYFAKRPKKSQLGTWASKQDAVIASRDILEAEYKHYENLYKDQEIPLPPTWGGFRIKPTSYEFWQGRESRLHDRFRYKLDNGMWMIDRISP